MHGFGFNSPSRCIRRGVYWMLHGLNTLELSRSQRGTFTSYSFSLASKYKARMLRGCLRPRFAPLLAPSAHYFTVAPFHAELSRGSLLGSRQGGRDPSGLGWAPAIPPPAPSRNTPEAAGGWHAEKGWVKSTSPSEPGKPELRRDARA